MNKKRQSQIALATVERMMMLKGLGILEGTGIKGFYVFADLKTDLIYAVAHVLDVVHMMDREFKVMVELETDYDKLHRACKKSRVQAIDKTGRRIIAQVIACRMR